MTTIDNWGAFRFDQSVRVYMGAGWAKGTVKFKYHNSVVVQIDRRTVRCYDLRNIKPA